MLNYLEIHKFFYTTSNLMAVSVWLLCCSIHYEEGGHAEEENRGYILTKIPEGYSPQGCWDFKPHTLSITVIAVVSR